MKSINVEGGFFFFVKGGIFQNQFVWKMQKKVWYYEKWGGCHASFPPRRSVNYFEGIFHPASLIELFA